MTAKKTIESRLKALCDHAGDDPVTVPVDDIWEVLALVDRLRKELAETGITKQEYDAFSAACGLYEAEYDLDEESTAETRKVVRLLGSLGVKLAAKAARKKAS